MEMGHWNYPGEFDPEEWFGFIYRIVDLTTNKEYIGKKQFWSTQRKIVKGRKNRKIVQKPSDWRKYTSSSKHVNDAISETGKDNFLFLIESLHKSKASLHYGEVETQINEDVLRAKLPDGSRKYYNKMIANMKFLTPEELPEETKMKIRQTLKVIWQNTDHHYFNQMTDDEKAEWNARYRIGRNNSTQRGKSEAEIEAWINEHYVGTKNPMYGVTGEQHPRFGVTLTDDEKSNLSEKMTGRYDGENNPRFGKSPFENFSEQQLEEHKAKLSERFSGDGNPMYGKPCHYKMTDQEKEAWKNKISESTKGIPKSEETKARMRKPRGPAAILECPHCGKIGGGPNMTRYHFDKCIKKPSS